MAVPGGEEREEKVAAPAMSGRRTTRGGHPLLRGGWKREWYTHGMHPAQMEALRAMCGALIPSLPPADAGRGDPPGGKDLERFYLASAADATIPDEVNENSENPYWKAIGYIVYEPREDRTRAEETPSPSRPLDVGVVETRLLNDNALLRSLVGRGLTVKPAASDPNHHTVQCDAVIVGSGCGGGVAAAVLASAGYKVVVVEKGDYFTAEDYSSIEGPSMERLFERGGIFCTSNVTTMIFTGATVGGGSAVNWSASIRTPEEVTQEWAREHGLPVFASPGYVQAMDAVCARLGLTDACREEGFQNKVVRRGCEALGLCADAVPRNSSDGHFCGSCNFGCPTGDKRGTDTTWLVDAVARGAVILTGCKAEHFVFEKNRSSSGRGKKCVGAQ